MFHVQGRREKIRTPDENYDEKWGPGWKLYWFDVKIMRAHFLNEILIPGPLDNVGHGGNPHLFNPLSLGRFTFNVIHNHVEFAIV